MPNSNDLPIYDDPPQKHVLLLTCMDQRLLDDTVRFMNKMNLQNRYDQLVFAGSSLGAGQLRSPMADGKKGHPWKSVFLDHLDAAINTLGRQIKDIFLLEHLDCGAYRYLHPNPTTREEYVKVSHEPLKQINFHRTETTALTADIEEFCRKQQQKHRSDKDKAEAWKDIRVTPFVMDLIGRVSQL